MKKYQVEIVWNREFDFVPHGDTHETAAKAQIYGETLLDMGDGACVKKFRVVECEA